MFNPSLPHRARSLWIAAGLLLAASVGGIAREDAAGDAGWSYRIPTKPEVPRLDAKQPENPIDAFIGRRLRDTGLEPAPSADRRTLIRRATFDLTGLPPTPEETDSFVHDPASDRDAFRRAVERLLASPRYGEQWARHWLDVVRYADSSGLANDYERPNAWRYRDYVIRAFNEDKPYDRFVREQIAGDEIDPDNPEMLVAAGFLRMGPWELTGMEVARVARQGFLDDVTDAVGQVFLSHPLQCARCHDHKFDPIPTRDYYRIQAVFATTQFSERDAPFLPSENIAGFEERRRLEERIARYESTLEQIRKKEEAAGRRWAAEKGVEYIPRTEALKKGLPEDRIVPRHIGLTPEDLGIERIARKNLTRHRWELDRYRPIAFSVYSGHTPELRSVDGRLKMPPDPVAKGKLEETAILAAGDPFTPTVKVTPGVLSAVPDAEETVIPDSVSGRRKALADWIAGPKNPLTARSMVNRVWQYHFGRGIVSAPNNLGLMGGKPSHPELLDWPATWFIEKGWSVKALHRLILDSETYRRSSAHPDPKLAATKDPNGTSYAVFTPRRLAAEELRDATLALSGELNLEMGGIPVRPEISLEVALQPRQIMGTYAPPAYQPSPLPQQRHRRSIYTLRLRGLANPFMEVFNQPSPDMSCERRESSTVTPQVFTLFNSEESYRRALAFAARLMKETGEKSEAIERAFRLVYGRPPAEGETRACLEHWSAMSARHRNLKFDQGTPLRPKGAALELEPIQGVEIQRRNLDLLDRLNRRHLDSHAWHDDLSARMESYELASRMQLEVPGILEIEKEDPRILSMYGIGREPTDEFGRKCLLARRLVERGVRFVQAYAGTWDSHDYIARAHSSLVRAVDRPIAGLIMDLKQRGLLDQTLIIWAGEFGRSPDNGIRGGIAYGRDHNPKAMTIWFAGGGVRAGHTIGATDEIGAQAVEVVHHIRDLHVTILKLMGLDDARLTYFHGGRYKQLSQFGGRVIEELMA